MVTARTRITLQQLGGQMLAADLGPEGMRERGRHGGQATLAKYGPEHFRKLRALPRKPRRRKAADGAQAVQP